MKTYRIVLVVLLCFFSFSCVSMRRQVVPGQKASATGPWWPSETMNSPEFEAFLRLMDEKAKGIFVFPRSDPAVVGIEVEPEAVFNKEGMLTKLSIVIAVTKLFPGRYIFRQYRFHRIWTRDLVDIFYDLSFLGRSLEENKKLIYQGDQETFQRYMLLLAEAGPNIKQEAVDEALVAVREFATAMANGLVATEPIHQELLLFAECVDNVFRQVYEHRIGIQDFYLDIFVLIFDYDPTRPMRFMVMESTLARSVFGQLLTPFGFEILIAETVIKSDTCSGYGQGFAAHAFRAMLDAYMKSKTQ